MARPKKYDIDTKQVQQLASYGCTNVEIAEFFGCDESLIRKSYSEFITKGRAKVKIRLRQTQLQRAFGTEREVVDKETGEKKKVSNNDGSVPMLIWLGKQMLGQTDTPDEFIEELCEGFDLNEI